MSTENLAEEAEEKNNPVSKAIAIVGPQPLAEGCGLKSYQSVRKWEKFGMPRTEFTGETNYSEAIETLTNRQVKKIDLLEWTQGLKAA